MSFTCRICGHEDWDSVLDLGHVPPVNTLHGPNDPVAFYPLHMVACKKCDFWQLLHVPTRGVVFPDKYPYRSKTTRELVENFVGLAKVARAEVPGGRVLDIGGNDGSLLKYFEGYERWNVEPTEAGDESAEFATWIKSFWGLDTAKSLGKGAFDLILATNVFAHANDLHNLASGVAHALADEGLFILEVQDRDKLVFDTVYHEHVGYYSEGDVIRLLGMHGLAVEQVVRTHIHGGSLRVYARKGRLGFVATPARLTKTELVQETRIQKNTIVQNVAKRKWQWGQRIWGIGAPSRATTLLHYTGIHKMLDGIAEMANSPKVGLNMPGTSLPVRADADFLTDDPDSAIVLSWHLGHGLVDRMRNQGYRGDLIIPLREYKTYVG